MSYQDATFDGAGEPGLPARGGSEEPELQASEGEPTPARRARHRRRSWPRRQVVAAIVTVGVLVGAGSGVIAQERGSVGAAEVEAWSAAGVVDSAAAQPGAATDPTDGESLFAEERADRAASRSVRDPLSTVQGPGTVALSIEPVVDKGSGLTGTTVVPDLGGTLDVVPAESAAPGTGTVKRVRIEVEHGLPVDGQVFAAAVMTTLNDPRGWSASDGVTFARTGGEADIRVVLASPSTTDRLCLPLDTASLYSCGRNGAAVLNFDRWVNGAPDFGADLALYRHYLVGHEVGHLLGHQHEHCPAPGSPAPIMVQQSISTEGCLPTGWPNP